MKHFSLLMVVLILFSGCTKTLSIKNEVFEKESKTPCKKNCTKIKLDIPIAKNVPVVADSINKKILSVLTDIVYFGEKPLEVKDYNRLAESFIASYDEMFKKFPNETFGWEATITGNVEYQSDQILNIRLDHYTFTGGAHGYQGYRSLIFNPNTGKVIMNDELFVNENEFKTFAEKEFRIKYGIPSTVNINATGLMFENDKFQLPQNIFYTEEGLLLYYNSYEAASYADGPKEIFFPYEKVRKFLKYF